MKALRTQTPAALDNPSRWNQYLRPWFDVEGSQERINARVGLNKDGKPRVRLVWGQDVIQRLFSEETPRYWLKRQPALPHPIYWTVPRWIFESRLEPEQYADSWNSNRYSLRDPTQGSPRCGDCGWGEEPKLVNGKLYCTHCMSTNIVGGAVIDRGPAPDEYYTYMMHCARHETTTDSNGWPMCCTRAFFGVTKFGSPGSRCWGDYRQPNDFDLEVLSQSTRTMEAAKNVNPYRALTLTELQETELAANKQVERAAEHVAALEDEIARENISHFIRQPRSFDMGGAHRSGEAASQASRAVSRILEVRNRKVS